MLPQKAKQGNLALWYVFGRMNNLTKEESNDICKICGSLKDRVEILGIDPFLRN